MGKIMNRRMFLKTGSSAIAITGLAASGVWLNTRTPTKVYEPWEQAGKGYGDPRLDALAYAILAPNPHNRQPWQVHFSKGNIVDLYCDLERRLPHTDPYDRQIVIGLGCFTELFIMAAKNNGYDVKLESFPDGEPTPRLDKRRIARFTLTKGEAFQDPLFQQVFKRRSSKVPYDISKPIQANEMSILTKHSNTFGTNNNEQITRLKEISYSSLQLEMSTPRTLKESVDLMRIGREEIEKNPDGIALKGAPIELMSNVGIMTREGMYNPENSMNTTALSMFKDNFETSMGYLWVTSEENTRTAQLQAGRNYVRLNLLTTSLGIGMQPLSQSLQEFPEMANKFDQVHQILDVKQPNRIQMLARIGYCPQVEPSARWPLETILINT